MDARADLSDDAPESVVEFTHDLLKNTDLPDDTTITDSMNPNGVWGLKVTVRNVNVGESDTPRKVERAAKRFFGVGNYSCMVYERDGLSRTTITRTPKR